MSAPCSLPPFLLQHKTFSSVAVLSAAFLSLRLLSHLRRLRRLRSAVACRKSEQEVNFEKTRENFSRLPESRAQEILSWPYPLLKENLQNGSVSCVDVLRAYQRKAMEATASTNCVCLFIEEAQTRAERLDVFAKEPSYEKPPLFGIPVSVKECIAYRGLDCTLGYVQDLFRPSSDHSSVVKQLIHLGAVPFVQTNNPTSLLTYGCTNGIYGRTTHPKNKNRVPGGSSGGEGALLSLGGSILGIGSDIGGSIRIPSTFCGLAGFKPTVDRFSHINSPGGIPGRVKIIANEGPMAKDIEICIDYLRNVWGDRFLHSMDPYSPPVGWNEELFSSTEPLTVGVFAYDGFFHAAPAYRRAVAEAAKKLEERGHRVVPFTVPEAGKAFTLLLAAVTVDGGLFLKRKLARDIVPDDCDFGFINRKVPIWAQRLLRAVIPWPRLKPLLGCVPTTTEETRQVNADIDTYRRNFLRLLQEQNIDVLLCPPMCMYPPAHEVPAKVPATSYTSLFNVLDFPAGTVKMTEVSEEDEKALDEYPENDPFDKVIKKECKNCVEFPIGVQVAAPPFREEIALRVLKELQNSQQTSSSQF